MILKEKINNEIISYEIKTIHVGKNDTFFLSGMFDYNLIKSGDIDELIKLFYLTNYQEDFDMLYTAYSDKLKLETKIYLLNNAHRHRSDNIIKKYIVELTVEQINTKLSHYDRNILQSLCSHGSVISGGNHSYAQKRQYPIEDPELLAIVEFILIHKPQLIDENCYTTARNYNNHQIIKLLNNCKIDKGTSDNLCYICNSDSEPDRIINDICACKMFIHYHCAQELIRSTGDICKTCATPYKRNTPLNHIGMLGPVTDDKIYFPHLGVFPIPLFSGKYQIETKKPEQLILSIIYIQYKHILYLADNSTAAEMAEMKTRLLKALTNGESYGYGELINGKFKLLDNTCSNAPRDLNYLAYSLTETVINKKFIN